MSRQRSVRMSTTHKERIADHQIVGSARLSGTREAGDFTPDYVQGLSKHSDLVVAIPSISASNGSWRPCVGLRPSFPNASQPKMATVDVPSRRRQSDVGWKLGRRPTIDLNANHAQLFLIQIAIDVPNDYCIADPT
jgi:hypothetical protein